MRNPARDLLHVCAHVVRADERHDSRRFERRAKLRMDAAQEHAHFSPLKSLHDLGQRVEPGRIHERHAAQADHDGVDIQMRALQRAFQLFGGAACD